MIMYAKYGDTYYAIVGDKVYQYNGYWVETKANKVTLTKFVPDLVEVKENEVPEKLKIGSNLYGYASVLGRR